MIVVTRYSVTLVLKPIPYRACDLTFTVFGVSLIASEAAQIFEAISWALYLTIR